MKKDALHTSIGRAILAHPGKPVRVALAKPLLAREVDLATLSQPYEYITSTPTRVAVLKSENEPDPYKRWELYTVYMFPAGVWETRQACLLSESKELFWGAVSTDNPLEAVQEILEIPITPITRRLLEMAYLYAWSKEGSADLRDEWKRLAQTGGVNFEYEAGAHVRIWKE